MEKNSKLLLDGKPVIEIANTKGRDSKIAIVKYGPDAYRVFVRRVNYSLGRDVVSWLVSSGPKPVTLGEAYKLFDRPRRS